MKNQVMRAALRTVRRLLSLMSGWTSRKKSRPSLTMLGTQLGVAAGGGRKGG